MTMSVIRQTMFIGLILLVSGAIARGEQLDSEVNSVTDAEEGPSTSEDEVSDSNEDEVEENDTEASDGELDEETDAEASDDKQDEENDEQETAKAGRSRKTKKVFIPVFVPEREKKKMKIVAVDKGFYINGGTQLFGTFKTLKACMKACAGDSTCFQGDYNPWLSKCYKHTNYTACGKPKSHPQFVHFSKVPCTITDAPRGSITLGVSAGNGVEEKGVDSLQQCIKKCVNAGRGIPLSVDTIGRQLTFQACFAIDYDFNSHKCFVFGSNIVQLPDRLGATVWAHCNPFVSANPTSSSTVPNPTVVHITFCPKWVNFG